jgi:hypothetical protein
MAKHDPTSPDVMSIWLSGHHSLDIVRLPKSRKYRVVFAERYGVQRRAFVEVSFDQALALARFLVSIDDHLLIEEDWQNEPTNPGIPSKRAPKEILEIVRSMEDELDPDRPDEVLDPLEPDPAAPTPIDPKSERSGRNTSILKPK